MQRKIENAGFTTITLSNIPELTASVSVPRLVAIEYPFGRIFGNPGDREGQKEVLLSTLQAIKEMDKPGSVKHLEYVWQETPGKGLPNKHANPPIVNYLITHPWLASRLFTRDIPE